MITTGSEAFLRMTDQEALHPATVVEARGTICTAAFKQKGPCPAAGQSAVVYYEASGRFMQQPARIDAVMRTQPTPGVGLELTGEPVSAERRRRRRVPYLRLVDRTFRELAPRRPDEADEEVA